jgi:poly(hydroxyalkanoate) depolymerase family esterase
MSRYRHHVVALLTVSGGLLFAGRAQAAGTGSWQNNAFPSSISLQGDLYTPATPASPPAILVAIHMCTGHSSTVHPWFQSYADQYGFYIIAPDAGKQCFDASATRSGDRAAIVAMVNWVITNKNADKTRVFSAGMSSGGCMTNTLLAIYPDVFAGGSAMPGFPAGAWPAGDTTCTKCGSQPTNAGDGTYWGNVARTAFSWNGTYPCSQQWVGGGDEYNFNGWLPTVAAQFENLGNLSSGTAGTGAPSGWTRTVYKDSAGNIRLETNLGPSTQKHDLETVMPPLYGPVITFLGLDKPTGACGLSTTSTGGMSDGGSTSSSGTSSSSGATSTGGGTHSSGSGGGSGSSGSSGTNGGTTSGGGSTSTGGGGTSTGGHATGTSGTSTAGGGTSQETNGSSTSEAGGSGESSKSAGCSVSAVGGGTGGLLGSLFALTAAVGVRVRRRRNGRAASIS